MALRDDLPLVPQRREATMFNARAAKGFFQGLFGAMPLLLIGLAVSPIGLGLATPAMAFGVAGALVGAAALGSGAIHGYLGKRQIEHEQAHGKVVQQPTLFNDGIYTGALKGLGLAGAIMTIAVAAPALLPIVSGISIGSFIMTTTRDSLRQYVRMQSDVMVAETLQAERQRHNDKLLAGENYLEPVSAQEEALLRERMRPGAKARHGRFTQAVMDRAETALDLAL